MIGNVNGRAASPAERAAVLLILVSGGATVLGVFAPEGLGMIPLLGGITILLLGSLRREPLTAGFLLLLLLTLRVHLLGDERYLPEEIALSDYLLVMIAMAATFRTGRDFWRFLQILFVAVMTAAGLGAWILHILAGGAAPFGAGILTAPQTGLVYGIGFCFAIGHLVSHLDRDRRGAAAPPLPILWLLLGLVNAALLLASDGPRSLLLAGIALLVVTLCGRSRHRQMGGERGPPPQRGPLLAAALLLGAAAAVLPGGASPAAMAAGFEGLGQRLALLRCFLLAAFENLNRFLYGVGFTNSSTWLCREISPGSGMIQADHLPAQVAADNGALTLLGLGFVLFLLLRQGWRLSGRLPDPVLLAALSAALYSLLVLQIDAGWARNPFLQALLGFQLGALTLRSAEPPVEAFAAELSPRHQK